MLALCVGTYANDTDVSVDRPAEIPTEITYTSYNTICSLLVPVIRGVFFRVAPPIYTRMCIYPTSNERSLGTFPVTGKTPTRSSAHLRRANSVAILAQAFLAQAFFVSSVVHSICI